MSQLRSSLSPSITLPRQPSENLREHLLQIQSIRNAYEFLAPASPNAVTLLPPDSLFPALLALRTVEQTVNNTRTAVKRTRKEIIYAEDELSRERALLQDSKEFGSTLEARIGCINNAHRSNQSYVSGVNGHKEDRVRTELFTALEMQERRVGTIRKGTEFLKRAISLFIQDRLAPILLEEELSGLDTGRESYVGNVNEANNYNDDGYEEKVGLTQVGTSRKRKIQERNWRQKEDRSLPKIPSELSIAKERVSQEMEHLIEELVQALRSGDMDSYVALERVSSQARYLVSAKIVQYHPKEATRLRLIDFR